MKRTTLLALGVLTCTAGTALADPFPLRGKPLKTASLAVTTPAAAPQKAPSAAAVPPSAYTPAPMPNPDITAPPPPSNAPQAELVPGLYRGPNYFYQGEGFMPGSTMQGEQNKHEPVTPGLNLRLPLQ